MFRMNELTIVLCQECTEELLTSCFREALVDTIGKDRIANRCQFDFISWILTKTRTRIQLDFGRLLSLNLYEFHVLQKQSHHFHYLILIFLCECLSMHLHVL